MANVLTNPGFDTDLSGWSADAPWTWDAGTAKYGPSDVTGEIWQHVYATADKTKIYEAFLTQVDAFSFGTLRGYVGVLNASGYSTQFAYSPDPPSFPHQYYGAGPFHQPTTMWIQATSTFVLDSVSIDDAILQPVQGKEQVWINDVHTFVAWTTPENSYDANANTFAEGEYSGDAPSADFGGTAADNSVGAWDTKVETWTAAELWVTFNHSGEAGDDEVEILLVDAANSFATVATVQARVVVPPNTVPNPIKITLSEADWGTGFVNYQNMRVRVNFYRNKGGDNKTFQVRSVSLVGSYAFQPTKELTASVTTSAVLYLGSLKDLVTNLLTAAASLVVRDDVPGHQIMQKTATASLVVGGPYPPILNAFAYKAWSEGSWGDHEKLPSIQAADTGVTVTPSLRKLTLLQKTTALLSTTASVFTVVVQNFVELIASVTNAVAAQVETVKYTAVESARTYAALAEYAYNEMKEQAQIFTQELTAVPPVSTTASVETLFTKVLSVLTTTSAIVGMFVRKRIAASVNTWGRYYRSIDRGISAAASSAAALVLHHYRAFLGLVGTTADMQQNIYKNLVALVETTTTLLRDFTLNAKSVVVNAVATLSPGKLLHRAYAAVVGTAAFAQVRDIYQELHTATVGIVGSVSKRRTLVVLANAVATVVASVGTLFFISRELVANTVTATASLAKDAAKLFFAPVTATATASKNLFRRALATVGTVARRYRKFTDDYLAAVGTVGVVSFHRLLVLEAVVKAKAIFDRTVIKPVSSFVARAVFMVKRHKPSAVVQDVGPTTLRDCGDTLVVQGLNMADLDITIQQGATFDITLTWQDANGTPIDLTGYTARMQIRENIEDANFVVEITTTPTASGSIVLGGAAGTIQLIIPSDVTTGFTTWDEGVYDLEMISDAGPPEVVRRLLEGCVVVTPEVTR